MMALRNERTASRTDLKLNEIIRTSLGQSGDSSLRGFELVPDGLGLPLAALPQSPAYGVAFATEALRAVELPALALRVVRPTQCGGWGLSLGDEPPC
ncbi:hypothetical protein D3C71_1871970 [compost metagenome]